jgi:hypothetical protein
MLVTCHRTFIQRRLEPRRLWSEADFGPPVPAKVCPPTEYGSIILARHAHSICNREHADGPWRAES